MQENRFRKEIRIRIYPYDRGFPESSPYFPLQGFRATDHVYAQRRKRYLLSGQGRPIRHFVMNDLREREIYPDYER